MPSPVQVSLTEQASPSGAIYPSLEDKAVVITGGASGIGQALVENFVAQGARVVFLDLNEDAGVALAGRLRGTGRYEPISRQCDLTDLDSVKASFDFAADELGGEVDILINNAANDDRHHIEDVTPEYWDNRINVNLRHQFFCAQAVVPGMKKRGGGSIINLGSISWHLGLPDMPIYITAKAGIAGMTRALARDLGVHGIRVNCLVPGAVKTERQMKLWTTPEIERQILADQCLKSRVEPHHVAAMALFLGADESLMCTGQEFFVDAGWR